MTTFLPADYKLPKATNLYLKLQTGENKFRILSKPIEGWEDWENNKPKRFHMDKKPNAPVNPEKPIKHFWAFIVWNYIEKQIQIFEVTQASIKKQIKALSDDKDWGAPFFYDLKILKKGDKMDTEYMVSPLPHKPLPEEVINLFHDRPINLEALFSGEDPFSHLQDRYTPGVFKQDSEIELKPMHEVKMLSFTTINKSQLEDLTKELPRCSKDYQKKVWDFWKKQYRIEKLDDLPMDQYENIMNGIINHLFDIASEEVKEELDETN